MSRRDRAYGARHTGWVGVGLLVALLGLACPRPVGAAAAPGDADRRLADLVSRISAELTRVKTYLMLYDQLQCVDVLRGRSTPGDAEARLAGRGGEVYDRSYTDEELKALTTELQSSVRDYLGRIEQAIATTAQWPAGRSAESARQGLDRVRRDFDLHAAAGVTDFAPILGRATRVLAWTRGLDEPPPEWNLFAGSEERVRRAVPNARCQEMLAVDAEPGPDGTSRLAVPATSPPVAVTPAPAVGAVPSAAGGTVTITPGVPPATEVTVTVSRNDSVPAPPGGVAAPPAAGAVPLPAGSGGAPASMGSPLPLYSTGGAPGGDPPEFALGQQLFARNDLRGAWGAFNGALQRDPRHVGSLLGRAGARLLLADFTGARDDYTAALAVEPGNQLARQFLVMVLICTGDMRGARQQVDELNRVLPDQAAVQLLLGQVAMYEGNEAAAGAAFRRVVVLDPNRPKTLYDEAVRALNSRLLPVAAIQFASITRIDPVGGWQAWFGYGESMMLLGRNVEAIAAFREYLRHDQVSGSAAAARQRIQALGGVP